MAKTRGKQKGTEPAFRRETDLWRASVLHVLVFPTADPLTMVQEWWTQVTGEEPAETTKKRYETKVLGTLGGALAGASLILALDPLKILWTLSPRIDLANPPASIPTLGPYSTIRDNFAQMMMPWITGPCPPVKRVAFSALLTQDAASHADGYRALQRYLSTVQIDPESTDFNYRINRRRRSASVPFDLSINRLTNWSVAKISGAARAFSSGGDNQSMSVQVPPPRYATMLQVDTNTDAERTGVLPPENLEALTIELIDLANEITVHGDLR